MYGLVITYRAYTTIRSNLLQSPEARYVCFFAKKRAKLLLFFDIAKFFNEKNRFCIKIRNFSLEKNAFLLDFYRLTGDRERLSSA